MNSRFAMIGSLTAFACAQPQGADTGVQGTRFADIETIVVAPPVGPAVLLTGGHRLVPRFPPGRMGNTQRVTSIVAYVVDTTGAIEPGTVSFLNSVPADYQRVVCEWSRGARFEPFLSGDGRRRALTVSSFAFFSNETPSSLPAAPPTPEEEWLSAFRDMRASEVFSSLEKKPHC